MHNAHHANVFDKMAHFINVAVIIALKFAIMPPNYSELEVKKFDNVDGEEFLKKCD